VISCVIHQWWYVAVCGSQFVFLRNSQVAACCSMLQCITECGSVLQCVAVCCSECRSVSQYFTGCCIMRPTSCTPVQLTVVCCSVLSVMQCVAACCSVLQCCSAVPTRWSLVQLTSFTLCLRLLFLQVHLLVSVYLCVVGVYLFACVCVRVCICLRKFVSVSVSVTVFGCLC